jgi:protein tyrosine phosphatase type 4A
MSARDPNDRAADTTGNFSHIQAGDLSFLIMEQPKDATLSKYFQKFADYNVTNVVRVCPEITYDTKELEARGIDCHAFPYADGSPPPEQVTGPWLQLCNTTMQENQKLKKGGGKGASIAIHCIAGLGRAPVLVAIALIENGMDYVKAVETIRAVRHGAINRPQVDFLKKYQKSVAKRAKGGACSLM